MKLNGCYPNRFASKAGAMVVGALVASGLSAHASYTIDIYQSGSDVVVSGTGSVDLTDLSDIGAISPIASPSVVSGYAYVLLNNTGESYYRINGPTSFGYDGSQEEPNSWSGNGIGLNGYDGLLYVPSGYVSGTETSGEMTFDGATLSGLGLTLGTYTYNWGSGPDTDSLTVDVESTPEPGILSLFAAGGLLLGLFRWKRFGMA